MGDLAEMQEQRGQRIVLSVVLAALLAGSMACAFTRLSAVRGALAPLGLPIGVLLLLPLRYRTRRWQPAMAWQAIPAAATFGVLSWTGSTHLGYGPGRWHLDPVVQFTGLTWVVLFVGTLIRPIGVPQEAQLPGQALSRPANPPDWPPTRWSQEEWVQWWRGMCAWNHFRAVERREPVTPLSEPPPLPAPGRESAHLADAWRRWYQEYWDWDRPPPPPPVPVATVEERQTPFPEGWEPVAASEGPCPGCRQPVPPGVPVARCPRCRSVVCRPCVYRQEEKCPVCLYAP